MCVRLRTATQVAVLDGILEWARQGLAIARHDEKRAVSVQFSSMGLAGHSRGGSVAYYELQHEAARAAVLLDPVQQSIIGDKLPPTRKPVFVVGATLVVRGRIVLAGGLCPSRCRRRPHGVGMPISLRRLIGHTGCSQIALLSGRAFFA